MTRGRSVLASFLFLLGVFFVTHVAKFPGSISYLMQVTGGQKILDMQPSFSADETYRRLEAFGEVGRHMYRLAILTNDIIFPLSAFVFLFLFAGYSAEKARLNPSAAKVVKGFSITYLIFDFIENAVILALLYRFPGRLEAMAAGVGYFTVVKRISMLAALVTPIIILAAIRARFTDKLLVVIRR